MKWHGRVLTGNHRHWCHEWDGLPIDDTCEEFDACICERWNKSADVREEQQK